MHKPIVVILGFTAGVWFADQTLFGPAILGSSLFFALACFVYARILRESRFVVIGFFLLGIMLGALRFGVHESFTDRRLDEYLGTEVNLRAQITTPPDRREDVTKLMVTPENTSAELVIWAPREGEWEYGNWLEVRGILGQEKYGTRYQLNRPKLEPLTTEEESSVRSQLFGLKDAVLNNFRAVIPEPAAGLLGGLVLGEKHGLSQVWSERFRRSGLSHIVVLSGYNLTILAESLLRALQFLPRATAYGVGAGSIILFTLMTGAEAATVRAAVMALVALLARATGREYQATRALLLAGFIMLLYDPTLLTGDPGFQLSFLATLGLLQFSPLIDRLLSRFWPAKGRFPTFREIAVSTIAVQIFILPWVLYQFGAWSIVALPANLLVLPIVPITMFLGFLVGLVGFITSVLAWPIGLIAYLFLGYQLLVARFFAAWPGANFTLEHFPLILVIIFYLVYAKLILWHNRTSSGSLPSDVAGS